MAEVLWALPVPSTALTEEVTFHDLLGRSCALSFAFEGAQGVSTAMRLVFEGVEAFKGAYYRACTADMIKLAYDKLVDVGPTEWLTHISGLLANYGEDTTALRHLMIYFDDGPCYEFICRSFRAEDLT